MAWNLLENKKPLTGGKVDISAGARVRWRKLKRKHGEGYSEYAYIVVGAKAATALALKSEKHGLSVMFGTGEEAGKLAITVDNEKGGFIAKRTNGGDYSFTMSSETVAGKMKAAFDTIELEKIEIVKIDPSKPYFGIIDISAAVLA
jgi:hypothetical protein